MAKKGNNTRTRSGNKGKGTKPARDPKIIQGKQRDKNGTPTRGGQPKKDSPSKRVNLDNERVDKIADTIEKEMKSGKYNDISWDNKNPALLQSAGSYPVAPILGTSVTPYANPVPGLMQILWTPSFGGYQDAGYKTHQLISESTKTIKLTPPPIAINLAKDKQYSFLVHANSRNYNYNSADLAVLNHAGVQVFSIIHAMIRAYGVSRYYTERSRYTPDILLSGMGFIPSDIRKNYAQMWFDLNMLVDRTKQLWIPNTFPVLERYAWMNSTIFKDAEGDYGQIYMYVQNQYYCYSETDVTTGGAVIDVGSVMNDPFHPGDAVYTWEKWMSVANFMIDQLVNSEDRGIIYGDILNAYGPTQIYALSPVSVDYSVVPVYSMEALMEIENICYNHGGPTIKGLIQVDNELYPAYDANAETDGFKGTMWLPNRCLVNFHQTSQPTPEQIMLATRMSIAGTQYVYAPSLQFVYDATLPTVHNIVVDSQATPVPYAIGPVCCKQIRVNTIATNGLGTGTEVYTDTIDTVPYTFDAGSKTMGRLMAFDWHPFNYRYHIDLPYEIGSKGFVSDATLQTGTPVNGYEPQAFYGDFDLYTTISAEGIRKLHDVALFSEYDVAQMG